MQSLFNDEDRATLESRFRVLRPDSPRQWGKMNAAQMLAHCAMAFEAPLGDRHEAQALLGRLIAPFVRSSTFGAAPLRRNTPTDAGCVIVDERDFLEEHRRLLARLRRFCDRGPRPRTSESIASSEG